MTEFQRPSSVREAAYLHLREAILGGTLLPGTRISEPGLAESLGISRTPVREALQRLSQEGLVELSPNKGARVRVITPQEVREVYEVRALLEAEGARLAAQRASEAELEALAQRLEALDRIPAEQYPEQMRVDFEFHSLLMEASHNRTLARVYQDLRSGLALVRAHQQTLSQHPKTREQHRQILQALQAREAERAARAAKAHVLYFMEVVLEAAQRQGGQQWT
ncbi:MULTISPECIES: GntR family transcriptional regulator [Calidithermus]|uniref:GntR family transcriptional regulator n=1 Tax=Calidithermus TaxID=2747271 RepID=UPI00041AD84B|nr:MULTISPECIES: GntR family transcriptional regulator [Calidithermus]